MGHWPVRGAYRTVQDRQNCNGHSQYLNLRPKVRRPRLLEPRYRRVLFSHGHIIAEAQLVVQGLFFTSMSLLTINRSYSRVSQRSTSFFSDAMFLLTTSLANQNTCCSNFTPEHVSVVSLEARQVVTRCAAFGMKHKLPMTDITHIYCT
ncbi:hypothetical protein J6590_074994 [Homalodisca vitripennis]|nr:hypothetical protein J6590_074994 [Homalodisca vitripennis]